MDKIPDDLMVIGTIGAPFGVRGWLKINSFTDPVINILDYTPWQLKQSGQWREIKRLSGRPHGKGVVVQIEGVSDRDKAIECRGLEIAMARNLLPELDSDEVYWSDLVGMAVKNQQGEQMGQIDDVFETGANDVIVVKKSGQKEPILIPYVLERYIISIDKSARVVVVDWQDDY